MTITIREARAADIPALSRLLEALFSIEADFRPDGTRQQRGLELLLQQSETACVLVAEGGGQVVGMCTAQVLISTAEGGPVAVVEDVVVDAACRGQGVGAQLLDALESWARRSGVSRLQLLADRNNEPALKFYARQQWQPTQLVAMRKLL